MVVFLGEEGLRQSRNLHKTVMRGMVMRGMGDEGWVMKSELWVGEGFRGFEPAGFGGFEGGLEAGVAFVEGGVCGTLGG